MEDFYILLAKTRTTMLAVDMRNHSSSCSASNVHLFPLTNLCPPPTTPPPIYRRVVCWLLGLLVPQHLWPSQETLTISTSVSCRLESNIVAVFQSELFHVDSFPLMCVAQQVYVQSNTLRATPPTPVMAQSRQTLLTDSPPCTTGLKPIVSRSFQQSMLNPKRRKFVQTLPIQCACVHSFCLTIYLIRAISESLHTFNSLYLIYPISSRQSIVAFNF